MVVLFTHTNHVFTFNCWSIHKQIKTRDALNKHTAECFPGEFLRKPAQKQVMFRKVFKTPAVRLEADPRGIPPLAARLHIVFFGFFYCLVFY